MSIGGHSLHKKDWLTLGALASVPAMGAFGVGPFSGLLGGSSGATMADVVGLGLGAAPGESAAGLAMLGSTPGGAASGGLLSSLSALQKANALMQLAQGPQAKPTAPQAQRPNPQTNNSEAMEYFRRIYGGTI